MLRKVPKYIMLIHIVSYIIDILNGISDLVNNYKLPIPITTINYAFI